MRSIAKLVAVAVLVLVGFSHQSHAGESPTSSNCLRDENNVHRAAVAVIGLCPSCSLYACLYCTAMVNAKDDESHPWLPVQRSVPISLLASSYRLVRHLHGVSVVG